MIIDGRPFMRNTDNKQYLARRIRRSAPIFIKGQFISAKNRKTLHFESFLELTALLHFEFDSTIIFVDTQPLSITYLVKGRMVRYTPDIFVVCIDENGQERRIYVEVKNASRFEQRENEIKFDTLKAVFEKHGKEFHKFDENELSRTKLKNLELLYQGVSACDGLAQNVPAILSLLPAEISLGEARKAIINAGFYENHLHYLLFNKYYLVDLENKLSLTSLLRLNVA